MHHKRKIATIILVLALSFLWLFGCAPSIPPLEGGDLNPPNSLLNPPSLQPPEELLQPDGDSNSDGVGGDNNSNSPSDDLDNEQPVSPPSNGGQENDHNVQDKVEDNSGKVEEDKNQDEEIKEENKETDKEQNNGNIQGSIFVGLSVHYLDVGQGDCVLICLPDGKTMMIDCGNASASAVETIKGALKAKSVTKIDYLVLTHPDLDHVGGTKEALKEVAVGKVYHPDVSEQKLGFDYYFDVLNFLKDKGAKTEISKQGSCIANGDYKILILSPRQRKQPDSTYRDFHLAIEPTETQTNNISPYIYLEYKSCRFLFTGDAGVDNESKLINDYQSNLLANTFAKKGIELKLEDIDFLKVPHHGSADSSSQEFINLLKPKNAIISVGGDNVYGHPSTTVQLRITDANENAKILRTDVRGTISVFVNSQGKQAITTQND